MPFYESLQRGAVSVYSRAIRRYQRPRDLADESRHLAYLNLARHTGVNPNRSGGITFSISAKQPVDDVCFQLQLAVTDGTRKSGR